MKALDFDHKPITDGNDSQECMIGLKYDLLAIHTKGFLSCVYVSSALITVQNTNVMLQL